MCAINGFNFQDKNLILKMNAVTRHRGPDGTGVFFGEGVSLGHDRLSIIDLSMSAAQPMKNADGNLTIVFNGEIYNFQDIKKELGDYNFRTSSDTEVILAAYQKWGRDSVKKFNGIFAFAIWDAAKQELFLARDQIGVKPFYYYWDDKKFIFSSEIKAILEHDVPRVLNQEAFNHYLRVLYVPEPLTMFDGIKKLPPASRAVLKGGRLEIDTYWQLGRDNYITGSLKEAAIDLRNKTCRAVERQLVSDRPLGIYLSGGIDSSVVLDCVAKVRDNIDTFSVGFDLSDGEGREKFNQDFYLARKTAAYYRADHHEVMLSEQDVLDNLEKAIWHLDEPISNPTILAMMKLASFTKKTATVVLGGDGGDELFGGYDRYRMSLAATYYQRLPVPLRDILNFNDRLGKLNIPSGVDRFALFMFQKDDILKRAVSEKFFHTGISKKFFEDKYFAGKSDKNFEELLMDADRRAWLPDFSLMMTDKASMSAGLEARVPFLDKELVEFAGKLPLKYKIGLFNTKIILKEAFRGRIPDFLLRQPKRGWFSPGAKWLRRPKIYDVARSVLSADYCEATRPIFKWDEVSRILEDHKNSKEYNVTILWAILTFQIWVKQYKIHI
ncbi:MAG: asparagine synthase (glutamine-hydrolyzing) [Candidatus Niyogibacteria bacterium]|nr:asparagine synthase (glutamine-hydrolyzing) [Candidatus Niyogibacteria bacterium]